MIAEIRNHIRACIYGKRFDGNPDLCKQELRLGTLDREE